MSVSAQPTPYPLLPLLGRGLAAGGIAGLATGLFSLLLAEPVMDRAIRLEEKRSAAEAAAHSHAGHGGHSHAAEAEELFSRGTQHFGLVVTAVVAGLAIGVFFTLAYALVNRSAARDDGRGWQRAMGLAGAGFLALSLLPALRYPANPPGVGDGGTVTERQGLWLAALVIGVLGMVLAHQVHQRLGQAGHGLPVRQLGAAAAVVATLAALFLLPDNPDPVPVPAALLWDFRVLSLGGHLVLWTVLGAVFAAPALRRQRPSDREGQPEPATASAAS
ncbi:CbtA family protein [Streptomyces sp. CA-250714]|uniref:CbtA family protein n=1 Tax=Streptomyces sp. CA-250714 TaxID=3240060 RepID=UPI003D89C820